MSEEAKDEGNLGEEEELEGEEKPKKGKRALIVVIILVFLLAIGGGAAYFMMKKKKQQEQEELARQQQEIEESQQPKEDPYVPHFHEMETLIVNLSTLDGHNSFLKVTPTVEVASEEDIAEVKKNLPRIRDSLQIFLRELRSEDLKGSAGIYKLRKNCY